MPKSAPLQIFILAGGRSSRMGRDKSRLLLGSKSFLQRIVASARELEVPIEVVTHDEVPGLGPMGGVATALRRSKSRRNLVLSCDMPLITPAALRELLDSAPGAVFTAGRNNRAGFPFVLPGPALGIVDALLRKGQCSIQELSAALKAGRFIPKAQDRWQFLNANTPMDYAQVVRVWRQRHFSNAILEIRHLTVRRGETPLIDDFSWKVGDSEHWAVLGPNGCGKTSLFSALLGYVAATKGDVFVLGEEFGDSDWPGLRKKIGIVSSSVRQMMAETEPAWITVASGKYAMIDFWGTPKRSDRADALKLLRLSECEYIADRPWAWLSQGERQRVLIARALMSKPALLILDEPCAGLDPAARERFLQFIERFGRRPAAPNIILVTHHVEEVMPVFTHALLMKKGKSLAQGPIPDLLTSRHLSKAFDTPVQLRKRAGRYSLTIAADGKHIT